MLFFLDTADVKELEELVHYGMVDGVTTNPSLFSKIGGNFYETAKEICRLVDGPVSLEVSSTDFDSILKEGEKLLNVSDNVVLKFPMTWDGVRACKHFSDQGVEVNMTLCFSANQALIAAKAGAAYVSPFIGRLDDIGQDGLSLIDEIMNVFRNYSYLDTKILAASVRNVSHVHQLALMGVDVITMPPKIMKQLLDHPLTDSGLVQFTKDWAKSGMKI